MYECNCLTAEDNTLPHYNGCATVTDADGDGGAIRTLAEIAAYRDIDTALYCLRELTTKKTRKRTK